MSPTSQGVVTAAAACPIGVDEHAIDAAIGPARRKLPLGAGRERTVPV